MCVVFCVCWAWQQKPSSQKLTYAKTRSSAIINVRMHCHSRCVWYYFVSAGHDNKNHRHKRVGALENSFKTCMQTSCSKQLATLPWQVNKYFKWLVGVFQKRNEYDIAIVARCVWNAALVKWRNKFIGAKSWRAQQVFIHSELCVCLRKLYGRNKL